MTAKIIRICDFHLQRSSLEHQANEILGQVLSLEEFAKLGGPVIDTAPSEMGYPEWPDKYYPGGEKPVA